MDEDDTPTETPVSRQVPAAGAWAVMPDRVPQVAQTLRVVSDLTPAAAEHLITEARASGRLNRTQVTGAVGILPIRGIVSPTTSLYSLLFGGGLGLDQLQAAIREYVADDDVAGIVLDVDSPGGSSALVMETAALIREARQVKPVVAVANTLCGSAAYWLASQADEVLVTPSGLVGSIGALIIHEETSALDERVGINTTLISAGRYKTEGNPFEPLSDEARAALQSRVDDCYSAFVDDVAAGRGTTAAAVRGGYGEGRVLTAERAVSAGLADHIGTLEQAVSRVARGEVESSSSPSAAAPTPDPVPAASGPNPIHVLATLLGGRSNRRGITTT